MKSFMDNAGRAWAIAINVDAIKRVRDSLDVNLLDAVEGKLIERLVGDPILLCDVIYVLCRPEAEQRGVSDEDFGRAMAGDSIDSATTSLLEELVAFFPKARRDLLTKALQKLKALEAKAIAIVEQRLEDPQLEQQLTAELESALSPVTESGNSFGSLPAH